MCPCWHVVIQLWVCDDGRCVSLLYMQEPGREYSHLDPEEDGLGPLEENDLIAFAYQIADGMVRTYGEEEGNPLPLDLGYGLTLLGSGGMVVLCSGVTGQLMSANLCV